MVIQIDENKRVVMRIGFAWAILVFVVVAAFYLGVAVTELKRNDLIQDANIQDHEARLNSIEKLNGEIATNIAVINNKLDTIQRDVSDVKITQREISRRTAEQTQ